MEHPWTEIEKLVYLLLYCLHTINFVSPFVTVISIYQIEYIIIHRGDNRLPNPKQHMQHQIPVIITYMHEIHLVVLSSNFACC